MPKSSHAYLPAIKVMNACSDAMSVISGERKTLKAQLIDDMRQRSWPMPKRRMAVAEAAMERHGGAQIVGALRADEWELLDDLMTLSAAAHDDDPEMRIYVGLPDFKLLEPFYELRKTA